MISFIMNRINTPVVLIVLTVHIIILLLIWGGLSTLGAAFILSIPLVGGTSYISFQKEGSIEPTPERLFLENTTVISSCLLEAKLFTVLQTETLEPTCLLLFSQIFWDQICF